MNDLCDACGGTGKPISKLPCICGGTGRGADEKAGLREEILSLQEENERLMEGLHQIRILEDSYDPEITVLSQIFDIVYKLESEVKHDQAAR